MSEEVSHVAREAKGLQQGLKEALKTRDPWDKEVEFQRKNLRRQYLRLLFIHPYAKESKDAETHLWMQTSYAFISLYKQRITVVDRALQAVRQQHQGRQGGHGPVEYRKLMQRFRQFLADEEKFWTQLVVRFHRSFCLDEAHSTLVNLGILSNTDDRDLSRNVPDPTETQKDGGNSVGRNHFQFPPEDSPSSVVPQTSTDRDSRLAILSKALVCLGDIARYRELYNESGGRPKAGLEETSHLTRKDARNKRGEPAKFIPRARNYDKAQQCYEHARLLLPYEGNPSHQLAILASYQKDMFGSLYHYYRALCVRQPYDTASENLGTILTKSLEQWKMRSKRGGEKGHGKDAGRPHAPRLRVEAFKEEVVVLHALWRLGAEKMDSTSPNHADRVREEFNSLVSDRVLPIDLISKAVVLGHGALWKQRMIRDPGQNKKSGVSSPIAASRATIESRIFVHIIGLHMTLLKIGLIELDEAPEDASENDLAQRITATFRRTLPALRIASKWLRANFKYVLQAQSDGNEKDALWTTYSRFSNALSVTFPVERLPSMNAPLDEDTEMRGFSPLNKMMDAGHTAGRDENGVGDNSAPVVQGQVHPNEEQLMRIADLLGDANILIAMEDAPVGLKHLGGSDPAMVDGQNLLPAIHNNSQDLDVDEDAMTETTSRTDDDPVGDAFRKVLDGSDGDLDEEGQEDDEIVWDPRASGSPVGPSAPSAHHSSPLRLNPLSPASASFSAPAAPNLTPTQSKGPLTPTHQRGRSSMSPVVASTATTAQDLLNNVMGVQGTTNDDPSRTHHQQSSAPQPQLLFGSGPPNLPGHSIWSTSLDNSSLKFQDMGPASHAGRVYPAHQHTSSVTTRPTFSGSNPQQQLSNAIPSSSFPQPIGTGGHHRSASEHVSLFTSPSQSSGHDPFKYLEPQPVAQRHGGPHNDVPSLYSDPMLLPTSRSDMHYPRTSQDYHHHHQDPRMAFLSPPMSQVWGSSG